MPDRYNRQKILKGFGEHGQESLQTASVLVIGAGGLGCPVLTYLNAMGVGCLGLVDGDVVDWTNLHRQTLFSESDIGGNKAVEAARKLRQSNSETSLKVHQEHLTKSNALELIAGYDVIVDCSDNFPTRYLVNDVCVVLNKALVYGAISGFEGQVGVFNYNGSGNYRDLYPQMPKEGEVQSCSEAGVIGVLAGIIGCMQAAEVVKILTQSGEVLAGKILTYDMRSQQSYTIRYPKAGLKEIIDLDFFKKQAYEYNCLPFEGFEEIDATYLEQLLSASNAPTLIDVRNEEELPVLHHPHLRIPLRDINADLLPSGDLVFVCASGSRSITAARQIAADFPQNRKLYSLKGGIRALLNTVIHS